MVREITILPDFTPGYVEVGGKIPKFQYKKSLKQELEEESLTREEAIDLLKCMLLIRNLEIMICDFKEKKGVYGPLKYLYIGADHVSIGQEAVSAGAISTISVTDFITSNHRGHGDALAKGYFAIKGMDDEALVNFITEDEETVEALRPETGISSREQLEKEALRVYLFRAIAELFGKEAGWCRGRGGSMHIADFKRGHLGANAIVGGSMGMAVGSGIASRYLGDKKVTLCFVGDGGFNNGISHETMNMACMAQFTNGLMNKKEGVPVIFCAVNNQYGYTGQQRGEVTGIDYLAERCFGYGKEGMHAEVVNGMDILATRDATKRGAQIAREGKGPVYLEFWCSRFKGHNVKDKLFTKEDESYRTLDELSAWQRVDPINTYAEKLVEEGIVTREQLEKLGHETRERNEQMAQKAAEAKSPDPKTMYFGLFSETTSEQVPERFRNAPTLKKPSFLDREPEQEITFREAINECLFQEMARDKRVVQWGEDVADYGGAYNATKGLLEIFGRDRIFNTAISEAAIIGGGIGAALRGLRPVMEIMYIDFILLAMDQVANQAAKWKYMSGGQPSIPLTIRVTIGGGKGYAGQHSQSLEAILAHFPGLKIVVPSDAYDAKGMLASAIRDDNPVIFIEHQNLYEGHIARGKVPKEEYLVPLGKADVKRKADTSRPSITLISWSSMVTVALQAAKTLQEEGIELEVVDVRTLFPLDVDTIISSVKKTNRVVILHQAVEFMGFGAELIAQIQQHAFDFLDAPIKRIAAPNTPPPSSPVLEKAFLPNERDVIMVVKNLLNQ
ncbi:dehydrogenase E1 component subunit alpha/beta [Candidatus Aerophobetes bacterium]|nr:dehydrogenase E1 component subunit alpha/beta [Candidatus Aerophobetes bacterium]